jgi:hypothetical protein
MADALTSTIQKLVDQRVQTALGPHFAALQQLAAFLRTNGMPVAARRGRPPKNGVGMGGSACAIIGCPRPSRSKGYCAAHYQKMRNLTKSNRLPSAWTDSPKPQSVDDIKLPRGRAAQKAKKGSSRN